MVRVSLNTFGNGPKVHLLGKSLLLLGAIRLGLWLLPFRTLRHLVARAAQARPELRESDQASVDRVVWAVTVASRYVPKATCLTQALATQVLLARRGHSVHLRIGVAHIETGEFQAHAWVECHGRVVIGGADAPVRFTPLPPLDGKRL
jgi:hypothetical protein